MLRLQKTSYRKVNGERKTELPFSSFPAFFPKTDKFYLMYLSFLHLHSMPRLLYPYVLSTFPDKAYRNPIVLHVFLHLQSARLLLQQFYLRQ